MGGKVTKEQRAVYWQNYIRNNPGIHKRLYQNRLKKHGRKWKQDKDRAWREANKNKRRESNWKIQGIQITVAEYDALLASQKGKCAICLRSAATSTKYFPVDHDHRTGKVRGILCGPCNTTLSHWVDNVETHKRIIKYLEASTPQPNAGSAPH